MAYEHCICDTSLMAGTKLPSKHVNVKIPADLDNGNIVALGALAVLLTSAGAFVVIRRKSRA